VRLLGPEVGTLRRLAGEVRGLLRSTPGADQVHDDWDPETPQVRLAIDSDRAAITGLSSEDVARALATGLSGSTQTYLRDGHRLIEVAFRLRPEERTQVNDLFQQCAVSSLTDARVPLSEIARLELDLASPKVRRRNHERCITVKCDAVPGVLPSEVVARVERGLAAIAWPPGYRFELGGERAEQAKGFASVELALMVSLIGIYLVLVLQFDSVTKPLIVFAAVPFGVVGGVLGLFLFDAPFGFMAFLGVASLAGVIVSHIIVLFDWIEEARHRGVPLRRAVIDSALVRLRPVLVTVLAAVAALVPLALQGGPLWEPMCYVLIVGLLVATLVTKLIVPVLYVVFVEDLRLIAWDAPAHPVSAPAVASAPPVPPVG
jgi:multidrug efflux pump subunit AcrB